MKIGIIGLGYVGLPLALAFSKKYKVSAFDINKDKIIELNNGHDRTGEISNKDISRLKQIHFSNDILDLINCNIYIIAVPTPVTKINKPNLKNLKNACRLVTKIIKKIYSNFWVNCLSWCYRGYMCPNIRKIFKIKI